MLCHDAMHLLHIKAVITNKLQSGNLTPSQRKASVLGMIKSAYTSAHRTTRLLLTSATFGELH